MNRIVAGVLLEGWVTLGIPAYAQTPEPTVAFEMPMNVDNWRLDILGAARNSWFRQVHGACQITLVQNLGVDAAKAKGLTPNDSIEGYVRKLRSHVGEVARTKAADLVLRASAGTPVTFLSEEFSYRGKDGIDYRNLFATQWVSAVELIVIEACPLSEWESQKAAIDAFFTKVAVRR